MDKERLEQLSIILETLAFMLVTVDLYGKKRLEDLRERLKELEPDSFFDIMSNMMEKEIKTKSERTWQFYICVGLGVYLYYYHVVNFAFLTSITKNQIGYILIMIAAFVVTMTIVSFVFHIIIFVPFYIAYFFTSFCSWLMNKRSLEGVMILIGSVLFLVSKSIAYFNT